VSNRSVRTPNYRLHKPTNQAVVTIDGKDIYLGRHGTSESRAEYDRRIAEWLGNGRRLAHSSSASSADSSINEVLLSYLRFAGSYYIKNGRPTSEPANLALAFRPLRQLYGHTPAVEFGPLGLKPVRRALIDLGICRNEVNKRVGKILRAFKWAVGEEMIPPSVHHGLSAVSGLRRGRTDVRESAPVRPIPDASVNAVRPHVPRRVWAMIELQRLSGMRPGEVCSMRSSDLDTSGQVWLYTPSSHKSEHHGKERRVYLGPQAKEILRPWLRPDLSEYLFSPAESLVEKSSDRRRDRKTPLTPSQRSRVRKASPAKTPGECYTTNSYRQAIVKACGKAGIPNWHPNQLRHNAATRLRKEFGLDTARAVLGHSSTAVTEIYAELDREKAAEAMARVG
jgi:integrase